MKKLFYLFLMPLLSVFLFSQCDKKEDGPGGDGTGGDGPDGGSNSEMVVEIAIEDMKVLQEIAMYDTTGAAYDGIDASYMSATVNWLEDGSWYDEFTGVKISVDEQKKLMADAVRKNGNKPIDIYIMGVIGFPATTAQYKAMVYSGDESNVTEVVSGESVDMIVVGNTWPKTYLYLNQDGVVKITGETDLFVGMYIMNAANGGCGGSLFQKSPAWPGDCRFPSFGMCPDVENVMQNINTDRERWNWTDNSNWAIKVIIGKEVMYN